MIFTRTEIPDVFTITPKVIADERGYFMETYRQDLLENFVGHKLNFIQDNESKSSFGVLRGLHFQIPPFSQAKLIRVIEGEVLDVSVDLRKSSPTFGKHVAIKLSDINKTQLFIPEGFAHGFVVLSPTCTFTYKVNNYYNASADRGVNYSDTDLAIDWGIAESLLKISNKDKALPKFSESVYFE